MPFWLLMGIFKQSFFILAIIYTVSIAKILCKEIQNAYLRITSNEIAKPAMSVANFRFLFHATFHPTTVPFLTSGISISTPPTKPEISSVKYLMWSKWGRFKRFGVDNFKGFIFTWNCNSWTLSSFLQSFPLVFTWQKKKLSSSAVFGCKKQQKTVSKSTYQRPICQLFQHFWCSHWRASHHTSYHRLRSTQPTERRHWLFHQYYCGGIVVRSCADTNLDLNSFRKSFTSFHSYNRYNKKNICSEFQSFEFYSTRVG